MIGGERGRGRGGRGGVIRGGIERGRQQSAGLDFSSYLCPRTVLQEVCYLCNLQKMK